MTLCTKRSVNYHSEDKRHVFQQSFDQVANLEALEFFFISYDTVGFIELKG